MLLLFHAGSGAVFFPVALPPTDSHQGAPRTYTLNLLIHAVTAPTGPHPACRRTFTAWPGRPTRPTSPPVPLTDRCTSGPCAPAPWHAPSRHVVGRGRERRGERERECVRVRAASERVLGEAALQSTVTGVGVGPQQVQCGCRDARILVLVCWGYGLSCGPAEADATAAGPHCNRLCALS